MKLLLPCQAISLRHNLNIWMNILHTILHQIDSYYSNECIIWDAYICTFIIVCWKNFPLNICSILWPTKISCWKGRNDYTVNTQKKKNAIKIVNIFHSQNFFSKHECTWTTGNWYWQTENDINLKVHICAFTISFLPIIRRIQDYQPNTLIKTFIQSLLLYLPLSWERSRK